MEFLAGTARQVAEQVAREEESRRRHIVIALSGAHAYGFPSPDSDLDLKAVHAAPARQLLGLGNVRDAFDRMEVIDGVEIDYTSNELRGVLAGILAGNGNYIERVLGKLIVQSSPEHEQLRELVPGVLCRRVHRHYRGFAHSQRRAFEESEQPTVKKLLYVLRTALTGIHLLRTKELRVDLTTVAGEYGYGDVHELITAKKQGERVVITEQGKNAWTARLDDLFRLLDEAREHSPLPEEPPSTAALDAWLVDLRARSL